MIEDRKFGRFEIACAQEGRAVELPGLINEKVYLAFDVAARRLVELHIMHSGESARQVDGTSSKERAEIAAALPAGSRLGVLDSGEIGGLGYYSAQLNDGEALEEYLARRGSLPRAMALGLTLELLESIIGIIPFPRLLAGIRLNDILVSIKDEIFLQLRLRDLGISAPETNHPPEQIQCMLVREFCLALFAMLTGKPYDGDDCDSSSALNGLPDEIRKTLRSSLAHPDNFPCSLEHLRAGLREGISILVRDDRGPASRRHLVARESMIPKSSLRSLLLQGVEVDGLLRDRLVHESELTDKCPFSLPVCDTQSGALLTAQFLPPACIVPREHLNATPVQMWRLKEDKHPNILRITSTIETPDITCLAEERGTDFPLNQILASRVVFTVPEVLIILRQVKCGLDQAHECGAGEIDIHPNNVTLRLTRPPSKHEIAQLINKRLGAWPRFRVMLRTHRTMRSLIEPKMVEVLDFPPDSERLAAKDFNARSFVALAAYLLRGGPQLPGHAQFPDTVGVDLQDFVSERVDNLGTPLCAPSPEDFLAAFEKCATFQEDDKRTGGPMMTARAASTLSVRNHEELIETESSVLARLNDSLKWPVDAPFHTPTRATKRMAPRLLQVPVMHTPPVPARSRGLGGLAVSALSLATLFGVAFSVIRSKSKSNTLSTVASAAYRKIDINLPRPEQIHQTRLPAEAERNEDLSKPEEIRRAQLPTEAEQSAPRSK